MRVALVALHFAEYAARLAIALSEQVPVQLHLSERNAQSELDSDLFLKLRTSVDLRFVPRPTRRRALLDGARIARSIRSFGADVVHAQEASPWTTWLASALSGCQTILTVHDPMPHSGADLAVVRKTAWPRDRLRKSASAIIVHGRSAARMMPPVPGSIIPVPHGTLGEPVVAQVGRGAARFLFFGRIEAYKGLDVALEAARRLDQYGVDYELVIAGHGSELDRHRSAIASMPNVRLDEGFVPAGEVAQLFATSTAAILPYIDATQSGVAAYAFGAGTPVIASRVGALPDVVDDGVNGLLVPAGDSNALAAAMVRLLSDRPLASRLAEGAAETARTTLSWDRIAGATLAVYLDVLSKSRLRPR